ncbi:MAG: sulfatase-like hydrolase/transferase [Desulfuromonadaceae bacterium]|nr:sulfatase-like hydrolase/transferase [Desulfuromonadaceae bacterium]
MKHAGHNGFLISLVLCLLVQLFFLYHAHFTFAVQGQLRWIPLLLSLAPGLGLLFVFALFMRPWLSLLSVTFLFALLNIANDKKSALVGEPLCWNDIQARNNAEIIVKYLDWPTAVLLLVALGALAFCAFRLKPKNISASQRFLLLSGAALLLLLSSVSSLGTSGGMLSEYINYQLKTVDAGYTYWDWPQNLKLNGLPRHVIQTSRRLMPEPAGQAEKEQFEALLNRPTAQVVRPRNILFILCEACWHDEQNFYALFEPLRARQFKEMRAISPVYGGRTVNASFEFLTGLPCAPALSGVIYQEYASLIADKALALPRLLKREGYKTIAVHNYYKKFWNRQTVLPKLGFDAFVGLEDMAWSGTEAIPSDQLVFDAAYQQLVRNAGQPVYMFITTVATHGPYRDEADQGEKDYSRRLSKTLEQFCEFSDKVRCAFPDTLIVFAGDHKPGLTRFLLARGVFKPEDFDRLGTRDDRFLFSERQSLDARGDVPVYIWHPDTQRLASFIRQADGKPFYLLSQLLDDAYTATALPAYHFSRDLPDNGAIRALRQHRQQYPGWLYSLSLFE